MKKVDSTHSWCWDGRVKVVPLCQRSVSSTGYNPLCRKESSKHLGLGLAFP